MINLWWYFMPICRCRNTLHARDS